MLDVRSQNENEVLSILSVIRHFNDNKSHDKTDNLK